MLVNWQIYLPQPKWVKQRKKRYLLGTMSFIWWETTFPSFIHTLLSSSTLFPLGSGCNQLWHEKTSPLSVMTQPVCRCFPSFLSSSPKTPWPPPLLPCILCVYEHQNAIRPSKTPLVPGLVGPTVAAHSQPSGRWLFLTTGPLLQPLWKITGEKSHSWEKNTGKCKTDRTTGADNTRQNTITLHQVTVGHCNCLRQQRDGGGGNCRIGGGGELAGAAWRVLMEWCHMKLQNDS